MFDCSKYSHKGEGVPGAHHELARYSHLGMRLNTVQPTWEYHLKPQNVEYMTDHQTLAGVLVPAAAYAGILFKMPQYRKYV